MNKYILMVLSLILIVGCQKEEPAMIGNALASNVKSEMSDKVIYFGHNSVGANILDGMSDVGSKLNVIDFYIGENHKPLTKISAFKQTILEAKKNGKSIDVAMMKLCYVDIPNGIVLDDVFKAYVKTMGELSKAFPDTKFVHMTVPLTTESGTLKMKAKRLVKKALGREGYNIFANEQREVYNSRLKELYGPEKVFDLAALESNGHMEYDVPALNPEYTEDGGHLNEKGRQEVAYALIKFLDGVFYN
jgi:hypothetical protein